MCVCMCLDNLQQALTTLFNFSPRSQQNSLSLPASRVQNYYGIGISFSDNSQLAPITVQTCIHLHCAAQLQHVIDLVGQSVRAQVRQESCDPIQSLCYRDVFAINRMFRSCCLLSDSHKTNSCKERLQHRDKQDCEVEKGLACLGS